MPALRQLRPPGIPRRQPLRRMPSANDDPAARIGRLVTEVGRERVTDAHHTVGVVNAEA